MCRMALPPSEENRSGHYMSIYLDGPPIVPSYREDEDS